MAARFGTAKADVVGSVRYANPARPGNETEKRSVNVSLCGAFMYHATSCFTSREKRQVLRHVLDRTSRCGQDSPWAASAADKVYLGRALKPGTNAFWRVDSYLFS